MCASFPGMSVQLPHALFVGQTQAGKSCLVQALLSGQQHREHDTSSAGGGSAPVWHIANKYYTADVALAQHTLHADPSAAPAFQLTDDCEALVLVFNASSPSSFASVKAWVEASQTDAPAIRLVVTTHLDLLLSADQGQQSTEKLEPVRPKWLDEAIDWCCENSFEYIETSPQYADLDARLQLDGDPQGVQRVRDALIAHMWSNHEPVPKAARSSAAAGGVLQPAGGGAAAASGSGSSAGGLLAPLLPRDGDAARSDDAGAGAGHGHGASGAGAQGIPGAQGAGGAAGSASHAVQGATAQGSTPSGGAPASKADTAELRGLDGGGNDSDLEDDPGDPVKAFADMMKAMMDTKERVAHLPDAERRAAAAAMALQFAAMFGEDEDEGSEDDKEDA